MNVLILEDENLTAKRLESLLHKYDAGISVLAKLPSVSEAVEWLDTNRQPLDLVFMDIHLEDDLGFRIFEKTNLTTPVIFTTAYDEYMIQAFKVNSIDYLLKPINFNELSAAIDKYKALRQQFGTLQPAVPDLQSLLGLLGQPLPNGTYKDRFMVSVGTKIRSIPTEQIAYFFLDERIVFLCTTSGQNLPVDYSLEKLTQLLDPRQFFRINRQYLVSLSAIQTIHTYSAGKLKLELSPSPRQAIFVSGDRMSEFKEWLGK